MTSKKQLHVPWLIAPAWKDLPVRKGLGHHRKPVGIILAANKNLECILESESLNLVTVRLLNDDSKAEGKFFVASSEPGRAASFHIGSVSVPFVDCDYLEKAPEDKRTMSIRYPSGSKLLPIYHFGDDEYDFFQLWDVQKAEFAYIESDYFGLLIPEIDKEATRNLPGGKHLDDLIVFYDDILSTYSKLIGVSFEESGTNQNVKNIFFLKADKNGHGQAYYVDWCTAVNSHSIKSFWLDIDPTNWGALHEIGHGHEIKALNDDTLNVNETWNNIFCFFYQVNKFGKDMVNKGLKKRGSYMTIDYDLKTEIGVKNWEGFEKLSFLVHMFYKAGQQSFTHFNVLTRQELAGSPYYVTGLFLVEKLMHFFAIEFEIDVYLFMKLAKAEVREEQLLEHYYVLANVAYPLSYLISDVKKMREIKDKLGLLWETSLVTPLDLSSTKLKNDFTIKIDPKLFDVIIGDVLKLMDGSRIVSEQYILDKNIIFKDIPIGVYKIFVEPNEENTKLAYDDFYAVVHANQSNELLLTAKTIQTPYSLLPDEIRFLGQYNDQFATLTSYPLKNLLNFKFFAVPHKDFGDELYASVTIRNKQNENVFFEVLNGHSSNYFSKDISIEEEVEIIITHVETDSDRLTTGEPLMNEIIDRTKSTNHLIVNKLGFQNKNKITPKELLGKNFLKKIDYLADKIRRKISLYVRPHCQPKYNFLLAVEAYERLFNNNEISKKVRDQYEDCLPTEDAMKKCDSANFNQ